MQITAPLHVAQTSDTRNPNVAFFVHEGRVYHWIEKCLLSLRKHSSCRVIFYHLHLNKSLPIDTELHELNAHKWSGRRMTRRVEIARDLPVQLGDKVMVLDTDLLFQNDPFTVFEEDFDLFYTTRSFASNFLANGGVWGFRVTDSALQLLDFMINQIDHPTWEPYVQLRNRFHRDPRERDWWTNQDFLCTLAEHNPPIAATTHGADPKYNYCPQSGGGFALTNEAIRDFFDKLGNPDYPILHYKEIKQRIPML